jgi:hypothetical protein
MVQRFDFFDKIFLVFDCFGGHISAAVFHTQYLLFDPWIKCEKGSEKYSI